MKPIALVFAADVPVDHVAALERVANEEAAEVLRFVGGEPPEALRRVARG